MIKELNFTTSSVKEINSSIVDTYQNINSKLISLSVNKIQSHKQGNNHTKDRSEVAGSSKKLFKQKGTGNARTGNAKSPIKRGGGKAHGPKFHKVSFKINKKTKLLTKMSALVNKINSKSLYVFDEAEINNDNFKKTIIKLNYKSISFVFKNTKDLVVSKKFSNYKNISFMSDTTFSVFKALKNDFLIISKSSDLYLKNLKEIIK